MPDLSCHSGKIPKNSLSHLPMDAKKHFHTPAAARTRLPAGESIGGASCAPPSLFDAHTQAWSRVCECCCARRKSRGRVPPRLAPALAPALPTWCVPRGIVSPPERGSGTLLGLLRCAVRARAVTAAMPLCVGPRLAWTRLAWTPAKTGWHTPTARAPRKCACRVVRSEGACRAEQ